jgi:hypothetical protein
MLPSRVTCGHRRSESDRQTRGKYVLLGDEEIKAAFPKTTQTIEAEDELVQVALQVLRADTVEGSAEPRLQEHWRSRRALVRECALWQLSAGREGDGPTDNRFPVRALIAPDSYTSRFRSGIAWRRPDSRRCSVRELREWVQR